MKKRTILFELLLVASLSLQGQGPVKDHLYKQSMVAAKNIMPRPTQEGSVLTNVNGRWGEGQVRAYKVYTALLTQSGTDAPVANVLENTLGGTVVWARDGSGNYTGTLSAAFPANKTFILNGNEWVQQSLSGDATVVYKVYWGTEDAIGINQVASISDDSSADTFGLIYI